MRTLPQYLRLAVSAVVLSGAGLLLGLTGWAQPDHVRELGAALLAALMTSALTRRSTTADDHGLMTPSFVVDFGTLLLLGGNAALFIATAGVLTRWVAEPEPLRPLRKTVFNAAIVLAATEAAWLSCDALAGAIGPRSWPWPALPIAAAVVVYGVVRGIAAEVIAPIVNKAAINREWPTAVLRSAPQYFIGASLAAGVIELVHRGMWELLPVAAIPLFFGYRAYADGLDRVEHEHRQRGVIESLSEGLCVVAGDGRVMLWNDALERIVECPRDRALGRLLPSAVPGLAPTQLPRAVQEALTTRTPRTLTHVALPSAAGARLLEIKVLPVADGGATLVWQDMTERAHRARLEAERRRLALAAEGANDGLWEWDLRTQTFYMSARWKALVGLPAAAAVAKSDEWLGRVHAEDAAALRDTLNALIGTTDRSSTSIASGTRTAVTGSFSAAPSPPAGRAGARARIAGSLTDTTEQGSAQLAAPASAIRSPVCAMRSYRAARPPAASSRPKGRRLVCRAVSRSRPLQGRERQPRPPGGR